MSREQIRILDGGTSTELVRQGETEIHNDPLWSARLLHSKPDLVKKVHKSFLIAGSDIVVTASYQASVEGFAAHLKVTEDTALELMKKSVHLAKEACKELSEENPGRRKPLVAGSVGPYGACLCDGSEYTGKYADDMSKEDFIKWHRPRILALLDANVDILAVETIPVLQEAVAVLELLKEFPSSKAWVTFSCKNGEALCHGESFCDAVETVMKYDTLIAVGINCTSPEYISSLLKSISHVNINVPIIVKPNSGELWERGRGFYGKESCISPQSLVEEWMDLGASWIGGCCQIFPPDISAIKETVLKKITAFD